MTNFGIELKLGVIEGFKGKMSQVLRGAGVKKD